jgi:Tol biopolymer transport system component
VVAYLRCKTEVEVVTLNAKAWVVGPLVLCAILVSVGASEQRDTLATQRISIASDGAEANGGSLEEAPALSADARFIAFSSDGDNLSEGDRGSDRDVFVRDRRTGITERISVSRDGAEAEGHSSGPAISGDGQIIVFTSGAPNLVSGDTNAATDVFLRDRLTGSTERVSVASNGDQANGGSYGAAVSDDGRFVAFVSLASDLVPGDTNAVADVFVHASRSLRRPTIWSRVIRMPFPTSSSTTA